MPSDRDRLLRILLPPRVRRLPADLVAVIGLVILTCAAVMLPGVQETPVRIVVGLPFVLFIPGYAFIAALFPEAGGRSGAEDPDEQNPESVLGRATDGIDGIERVALSFGTSIAIVPLLGLVLNFTPWGIRLLPVLLTVSGFTLCAVAVAAQRRWALPADERLVVPYDEWIATARSELFAPESRTDALLNGLLVLSVLLAAVSVTYAVAVPKHGEAFTEFYVLTENETGDLVADDYPTEFTVGESKPLHVGIGNHEHRDMEYTIVVELQRVTQTNNTTQVQAGRELDRVRVAVADNGTWHQELNLTPTLAGQRLRLAFLLYRDNPPAQPTVANAYRELHLWVNVTAPADEQARLTPRFSRSELPIHRASYDTSPRRRLMGGPASLEGIL